MDFPRNAPSFFFLDTILIGGELAQQFSRTLQRLEGLLAIGDIHHRSAKYFFGASAHFHSRLHPAHRAVVGDDTMFGVELSAAVDGAFEVRAYLLSVIGVDAA